ncbi:hypothetical protein [Kribbella sp. C-35]|uniref:hypothetical protein n=1 Tax=Kribbella sp. C-35 TaxID=2789276 RepID=UPI003979914F
MRATYEDLLRTARRTAVSAQRGVYPDEAEVMADWGAVLAATSHHLQWLRGRLKSATGESRFDVRSDNSLGRLAQAIGAGADLLAVQDSASATALDVREDLTAARAEVAAIALIGAGVVARNTRRRTPGRLQLGRAMRELAEIAASDVRRRGLGGIAMLAAGGPATLANDVSTIAPQADRWRRAHAAMPPQSMLTRDLRSTTVQLRTVCGQVWHLTTHLLAAASARLQPDQRMDLQILRRGLQRFDAPARDVELAWRGRLSDLSGLGSPETEVAFLDLKSAVDSNLQGDRGIRSAAALVGNHRAAAGLIDAVDELLWSADQVARWQQHAVSVLIAAGRLFVPRQEAARVEISYLRRPGGGTRPLQAKWVRTDLASCFSELTGRLADAGDHLTRAAEVARRLAGTSALLRRTADPLVRTPQPYVDIASGIADPGQELSGLGR